MSFPSSTLPTRQLTKPDEVLDAELDAEIQTMGGEAIEPTTVVTKSRPARRKLPAHLPVRERVLEPSWSAAT